MVIDTISNVKTYGGITSTDYDTVLNGIIMPSVNKAIQNYCGWEIEETTVTDTVNTDGHTKLFVLRGFNVSSFTASFDGDNYDTDSYTLDSEKGIVIFTFNIPKTNELLGFSYTYGYDSSSMPADIKMVFDDMCVDLLNMRKVNSSISSEKLGDYSVVYKEVRNSIGKYSDLLNSYVRASV